MTNIGVVNFSSGEVTPEVDARKDIAKYTGGCRILKNMIPDTFGNADKRPGTELIVVGNGSGCYYKPIVPDPTKIGISTMEELALIGNDGAFPLNGDYELLNNLDATGITFWPIGIDPVTHSGTTFTGTFDGNFFTISNMTIGQDITDIVSSVGLFFTCTNATIENLTISNMTIIGPTNLGTNFSAGLLTSASIAASTVTNCHVQGSITAEGRLGTVGGMFGQTNSILNICSADIAITGAGDFISSVGGLAGFRGTSKVSNCYARGSIIYTGAGTGLARVGGLFGNMGGTSQTMENCYAAVIIDGTENFSVGGFIGDGDGGTPVRTSNYWDNDLIPSLDLEDIGDDGDVAGVLKSNTTDMFQQATYINWDFDTIWMIDEGNDYPRFIWQGQADIKQVCQPL